MNVDHGMALELKDVFSGVDAEILEAYASKGEMDNYRMVLSLYKQVEGRRWGRVRGTQSTLEQDQSLFIAFYAQWVSKIG